MQIGGLYNNLIVCPWNEFNHHWIERQGNVIPKKETHADVTRLYIVMFLKVSNWDL